MSRSQTLFHGPATRRRQRKDFRCEKMNPSTGQPCNTIFTRAWNLQRHERDHHQNQEIDFIHYNPNAAQCETATPLITATPPASANRLPRIPAMDSPLSTVSLREQMNHMPRRSASCRSRPNVPFLYSKPTPAMPAMSVAYLEPMPTMSSMGAAYSGPIPTTSSAGVAHSRPTPEMPPMSVAYSRPTSTMSSMSVASVPACSKTTAHMRSASKTPASTTSTPVPYTAFRSPQIPPQLPAFRSNPHTSETNEQRPPSPPTVRPIRPVRRAAPVKSTAPSMARLTQSKSDHSNDLAPSTEGTSPERPTGPVDSDDLRLQSDAAEYNATSQPHQTSHLEQDPENDDAASDFFEQDHEADISDLTSSSDVSGDSGSRKRKRSPTRGRVISARLKPAVPTYPVKMSKKTPGQQRALGWLHNSGKAHFDSIYETLLAQWGVKADHWGTCVLLPEDWRAMNPVDLMAIYRDHEVPPNQSGRAWYTYADHATTLARAAAWFSDKMWPQGPQGQVVETFPRRGVDLDNFTSCGIWGQNDASHLCHHEHCIIHLVYESAATNQDRGDCCVEARFLRQERQQIPEHCTKHWPPCMMQHAALTAREVYHIQFAVLRQAMGIAPTPKIPRNRRFQYPTLESQLPCSFPAVTIGSEDLVDEVLPAKKEGRPDLLCAFCPHVKTFASITALWGHLVNKHKDISDQARLDEIIRTAPLWREYWEIYSDGGKYSNPTMAKLNQIEEEEGFGWQQVLEWGLRP